MNGNSTISHKAFFEARPHKVHLNSGDGNTLIDVTLVIIDFDRINKLFEHPYLDLQSFMRTKKQIQHFITKYNELKALIGDHQLLYCQDEVMRMLTLIYNNLISNFYHKSKLHEQVFKHVMFSRFRCAVSLISMQIESS